jgi:enediyne biosynthesis protein E7
MGTPPPGLRGTRHGRLNHESWQADMFGFLRGLAARYGDIVGFDLGRSPCILVNGAQHVHELFVEHEACLRKPEFVKDSNRGHWGDGLTTLEGSAWRAHRVALRPSFKPAAVAARLPVVAELTADMLEAWAATSELDLLKELRILTARIAARVVLDADVAGYGTGPGRSGVLPFEQAYGEDYVSAPGGDPTSPLVMVRPRAPRGMDAVVRIIDERIEAGDPRGDVLSELVQARLPDGRGLTREEIVGEIIQMLYAGHLTIPSSLVNFWRAVAANDLSLTLAAEADRLCAAGSAELGALSESLCLAALKESLRLHPPAPILYRDVEIPFELGGFECARDHAVWVSPELLHKDPRYFSEPSRFLVERFRKGRPSVPQSAYLPFGAGPRACVGSHLALLQMTLIALLTARRFFLRPISDSSRAFRVLTRG